MKATFLALGLTCICANLVRADFNPVPLTPGSYTFDIVVEKTAPLAVPYCINSTTGSGTNLGDNTLYEQGLYARTGQTGSNSGIPRHNTVFTDINNANVQFLMPPDYTTNNDLQIDFTTFLSGTFTFNTPTTATNLAILAGGSGQLTVQWTVTHSDSTTETGILNLSDWFTPNGVPIAWGSNGRMDRFGNYNNFSTSAANNNVPYLYRYNIDVSGASPITSIQFAYSSGAAEANFFAVSGNASGSTWTPIPVSGFNVMAIIPATFPLTATMDQGTNTVNNGNLSTWFEGGYVSNSLAFGLPPSGSTFNSVSQPTHHYQMGNYSSNNAILIDQNHQTANITPASPAPYTAFALLTAGGNIGGGNKMTNICILQHADGVNETNQFIGYDWFEGSVSSFVAWVSNGRVNMYDRTVNNLGAGNPKMFETYFVLSDTTSPVTNIVLKYKSSPGANSTTYVMAVSATAGGISPVVQNQPSTLNTYPGNSAQFSVVLGTGTSPVYAWQKGPSSAGPFANLSNGGNVSGATTSNLSLANVGAGDAAYYQVVITNAVGATTSAPVALYLLTSTNSNVLLPTDAIDDSSFGNSPAPSAAFNETVTSVLDRTTAKYLCYGNNVTNLGGVPYQGPSGFIVTPGSGNTVVSALRIYTANDHPERDPADIMLEGSNDGGASWATILADTLLSLPDDRNPTGLQLNVTNQVLQEVD
ncbi:MAG: C-terminal target protein, partial [Pedosphaera sp.]|nr:C-terminal target protein [Pedosphaera sp.]